MEDIANKLDDMRKWRNRSDYSNHVSQPKKLAGNAISCAQYIFKSF